MSIHADNTAPDPRLAILAHLADDLQRQPTGADTMVAGVELYCLIRWCMLKVEGRRGPRDTHDADRLYDTLTAAYERSGAFVGVSRGHAFYDVGALCEAVRAVRDVAGRGEEGHGPALTIVPSLW